MANPSVSVKHDKLLKKYFDSFEKAELVIKKIEILYRDIVFPPVNQLRYAGYHFNQYHLKKRQNDKIKELEKAINHCHRSYYDSYEVGIAFIIEQIILFKKTYRIIALSHYIPEYTKKINEIQKIQNWLSTTTASQNKENHYLEAENKFVALKDIYTYIESYRDNINKKVRSFAYKFILGAIILPLFLTAFYDFAKYKLFPPEDCMSKIENICNSVKIKNP